MPVHASRSFPATSLSPRRELRDPAMFAAAAAAADAIARDLFGERSAPSLELRIPTEDGASLAADVYLPEGPATAKLLLGPAMGVKRRFYAPFLQDLAQHGIASMVIDYRGIGGSRTRPIHEEEARLSDWGELDLAAATAALGALDVPGLGTTPPTLFVGHSVGGQLFGLLSDAPFRAALLIGSQAGWWGHWRGASRVAMAALWFGAVPLFTRTLGYLPMRALGQGEDIPGGVAREWATWGRDRSYVGVRAAQLADAGFDRWDGALRAVSITDDGYAPGAAVRALADRYRAARVEVARVRPRDVGARRLGHFGWFHPRHREPLWTDARTWLLSRAGAPGEAITPRAA